MFWNKNCCPISRHCLVVISCFNTIRHSWKTVDFLHTHVPNFTEPDNWPPNSPDLNPVDYSIWGALQQLLYQQQVRDIEHLKDVLVISWDQPGLYWSSNWTVSETISSNHCSKGQPCWTLFFWLPVAVWPLSTYYISFAYVHVCDVYDITNENEMFYFTLPHPVLISKIYTFFFWLTAFNYSVSRYLSIGKWLQIPFSRLQDAPSEVACFSASAVVNTFCSLTQRVDIPLAIPTRTAMTYAAV